MTDTNTWNRFVDLRYLIFAHLGHRSCDYLPCRASKSAPPSLGNRFHTKEYFRDFAKEASCTIEILSLSVDGFPYAPFRFSVLLGPLRSLGENS